MTGRDEGQVDSERKGEKKQKRAEGQREGKKGRNETGRRRRRRGKTRGDCAEEGRPPLPENEAIALVTAGANGVTRAVAVEGGGGSRSLTRH